MKFVDTPKKAAERLAKRKRLEEIIAWEIRQAKEEALAKAKNKRVGQLSLGETTLSNFGRKR